jgi:hypothetical protein
MALPMPSHSAAKGEGSAVPPTQPRWGERFALWVDGVGGYLVCLRDSVILGQFTGDGTVDVGFQADLSRKHALIRRQNEAYFLEPLASGGSARRSEVKIEGRNISAPALLKDGDELQLGSVVRLRFRRPHPLSATARLEPISFHRARPGVDAVLLMSESCVLGPRRQNHVVCRDWSTDLVLARQAGGLFCRAMQPLEIDGQACDGRGPLTLASRITGDDFCLSLEPI